MMQQTCPQLVTDWSATGAMIGGIGGALAGIATIALAIIGYRGLSAWRMQMVASRKVTLGDDLLRTLFEADEAIKYITGPFIGGGELAQIEKKEGESDDEFRLRQNYEAIYNRYKEHFETFNRLRGFCFSAKAILGTEVFDATVEVVKFPGHILSAASSLRFREQVLNRLERQINNGIAVGHQNYQDAQKRYNEAHEYFYGLDDDSKLDKKRDDLVTKVEELVRKELKDLVN